MSEIQIPIIADIENGRARLSKMAVKILDEMVNRDPVIMLSILNDSMELLNQYHEKAHSVVYPADAPESNIIDFPKKEPPK